MKEKTFKRKYRKLGKLNEAGIEATPNEIDKQYKFIIVDSVLYQKKKLKKVL